MEGSLAFKVEAIICNISEPKHKYKISRILGFIGVTLMRGTPTYSKPSSNALDNPLQRKQN